VGSKTLSVVRSGGLGDWQSGWGAKWGSVPDRSKEGLSTPELVRAPVVVEGQIEDDLRAFSSKEESGGRGKESAIDASVLSEPVVPPLEPILPAEGWDAFEFGGKKKKKSKKGKAMLQAEEPPVPSPKPEPTPVEETPAFPSIRLREGPIADPPPPLTEPVVEEKEDDWASFGATPGLSKMKKKKKGTRTVIEETLQPLSPPAFATPNLMPITIQDDVENWTSSIFGTSKKKKTVKVKLEPETEPIMEESVPSHQLIDCVQSKVEEEVDIKAAIQDEPLMDELIEQEQLKEAKMAEEQVSADSFESHPEPESLQEKEPSAKAAAQICPDRVVHLFDGKGWRGCRICRAWLSQITTELACTKFVEDDGYEIVH
jgi:hypothetical protein